VLTAISKEYSLNSKLYSARPPNVNGVEEMVALDIDSYNVLSVLRSKLWGLSESEIVELIVTPTKHVSLAALNGMARADSVVEAVKLIEPAYPFEVQGAQTEEELLDLIEDGFARETMQTATLAFVWQGLGPGTMLALVKLMEIEVSNLAAIAIGVEAEIEPKKILSKLKI
jgi:vacuolar-type H+-ATPase subunit C/Vma6